MNNINIYLSDFTPDKMNFLLELLKYENGLLKASYYEVSFIMNGPNKNGFEITGIKEIDEILPYLETVYKNRSIKNNRLDDKTTLDVIKLLYDGLKTGKIKLENDNNSENILRYLKSDYVIDDDIFNEQKERIIEEYKHYHETINHNYLINKRNIKNYLKNLKKDNK